MLDRQANGVRGRLPQATDRGVRHGLTEVFQKRLIPSVFRHELDGFFAADAAWRALATTLVLEKAEHVKGCRFRAVLIREDDDRRGPDETAKRLERIEIERDVMD